MTSDPETTSPAQEVNDEITRITNEHKKTKVETLDHKTDLQNCGELSRQ